jgi:hypothetical protein
MGTHQELAAQLAPRPPAQPAAWAMQKAYSTRKRDAALPDGAGKRKTLIKVTLENERKKPIRPRNLGQVNGSKF